MPKCSLDLLIPFFENTLAVKFAPLDADFKKDIFKHEALGDFKERDTLHHIYFCSTDGIVMVLPFSFIDGKMPAKRLDSAFPDGYQVRELMKGRHTELKPNVISVIEQVPQDWDEQNIFKYNDVCYKGDCIIASCNDGVITGLTFKEIVQVLTLIEISRDFTHVAFYPPC
jgi:hypothetical protein